MAHISSLQIGPIVTEGDPSVRDVRYRRWTSAFRKSPVPGRHLVGAMGIAGDHVADTRHHGGLDKAILCYAQGHYSDWQAEFPELAFGPGGFGENLTIAQADESAVCLGDRFRIGDSEVQVSQPRQPCWKIARRWGEKTMTKRVIQTGRTGWYLRVLMPGEIEAGMELVLLDRPHPSWTVRRANEMMFGKDVDRADLSELMAIDELAYAWKRDVM